MLYSIAPTCARPHPLVFCMLLLFLPLWLFPQKVVTGAEQLDRYLPLLSGKQVGLVVNHSSLVGRTHLVDTLYSEGVCLGRIFAPEHGFRGAAEAGELVKDGQDVRTGTPITSLYGKRKKPTAEDLAGLDVVVFDIQDVGARFFTYISTLFLVLEACAEQGKEVLVLDRPNPNGWYVDGPVLMDPKLESFVGIAPLPLAHGCTVGELARLFCGENWVWQPCERLQLTVIPCAHYDHRTPYDPPVPPSPNLPNTRSVLLYPSICLFEGTVVSLGRGTDMPFQVLGHPEYPVDSFSFVPRSVPAARRPPNEGLLCKGYDLRSIPLDSLRQQQGLNLGWLLDFYHNFSNKQHFFLENRFFDLLAGNRTLRQQIIEGCSEAEIRASWADHLTAFRAIRQGYLLYPE